MCFPALASAQDRSQARSLVMTTQGIVATAQTLASQAGAQILARGGSAVDAAIAANAVLSVVEPMMNGPGGDLFALYWDAKTGKLTGINASGWTPQNLTLDYLDHHNASLAGIHSVTVPGCVAGWEEMHKRFGRLPWKDLFRPAIYYAENGFPVTDLIQWDWDNSASKLGANEYAKRVFLPKGQAPKIGEVFRNPDLAHAFRVIADLGAASLYAGGPIGEALLKTSQRLGGTMTVDDLRAYRPEWVEPISTDYRGWKIYELPPNGQGVGTLEMLNILEFFPVGDYEQSSANALHWKIEAQKLATQDLKRYVADPRVSTVPTAALLSKKYARERAALIAPDKANCDTRPGAPQDGHGNTTYLSVVDKEGNIVSWIQSISDIFGSGIAVDGFGFVLHDRGEAFSLDPQHPNALGPRKRPFHTIIPGFMERGDEHVGFGIMRGMNQAQAQAQFVSNVVDHKMNLQAALEAPRFTKSNLGGCDLRIEGRVPAAVRAELVRRGHELTVQGDFSGYMGGGQAVSHNTATRVNAGASSPRKDGAAIPEPDPYFR
jgi:gamma-glutamyltranspeptidase/glutathione hydrolase